MGRPAGSKNKPKQTINNDGYANAVMGSGTRKDRSIFTGPMAAALLDQYTVEQLYIGSGLARRIVDMPAEEMTRCGFEIDGIEEDQEESVESKAEELKLGQVMNDAVRWSRLYGGAVVVIGANDGGTLDVPLNRDGVRDVEFLRVYDRYQATVRRRVSDPGSKEYGQPELWLISPTLAGTMPYVVHNSRVIVFDGEALPDRTRSSNDYWGASTLQQCYDEIIRLGMSHQWANSLLERSQQAIHKINELAVLLRQPGGEALVKQRVDVVDMVRGILNTIVIDGNEEYDVRSMPMTGVPDILDRFAEMLSAVTGIPMMLLMGRSPGGLNATGKGDLDTWYAKIESMQNDILRDPIMRIVDLILVSKNIEAPKWHIEFKPLKVLSEKECAEIDQIKANAKKIKMETDSGYAAIGVVDPAELRNSEEVREMYPSIQGDLEVAPEYENGE